jgi:hypothetical protein
MESYNISDAHVHSQGQLIGNRAKEKLLGCATCCYDWMKTLINRQQSWVLNC